MLLSLNTSSSSAPPSAPMAIAAASAQTYRLLLDIHRASHCLFVALSLHHSTLQDYFTILHGEQWAATAGSFTKDVYRPGDTHSLPAGTAEHYKMPGECWALEYAYGNIVTMMPFGLIEVFTSTLDFESMFDTIVESGSQMLGNLRQGKV